MTSSTRSNVRPRRGEIWRVELEPVRGSEQGKMRPVLILSEPGIGRPTMRLCAPIMGRKPEHGAFLWCLTVEPSDDNGLTKKSTVDASQTRALDLLRFEDKLGQMARDEVDLVAAALCSCVKS